MRTLLFILLFTYSTLNYACECGEYDLTELDERSYEYSDVVLIGEVIKTGINYRIRVKEVLKGKVETSIILGTIYKNGGYNTCTGIPRRLGEYLFYLEKFTEKRQTLYRYSSCLGSRLLNFEAVVIPLRTNKKKSELIDQTNQWIRKLRKEKI